MLCGVNDMGRRTKLTPELIEQAAKLISQGNYAQTVFQMLGIPESTWYGWLQRGRESERRNIYSEFSEAVKKAEAAAELRAVSGIVAAGRRNWTAFAWYLERKYPDRWGRRDKIQQEISGPGGEPVSVAVDLSVLTDEELRSLESITKRLEHTAR